MRFDRDRWYSSENHKAIRQRAHQESSGTRRIISLALLLAMILVIMQQLNNPSKYEPAFRSIGLVPPTDQNAGQEQKVSLKTPESLDNFLSGSSELISLPHEWQSELQKLALAAPTPQVDAFAQMWEVLLRSASPEVINEIGERFFVDQRTAPSLSISKSLPSTANVSDRDGLNQGNEQSQSKVQFEVVETSKATSSLGNDSQEEEAGGIEPVSTATQIWLQQCSDRVRKWSEDEAEISNKKPAESSEEPVSESLAGQDAAGEYRLFEFNRKLEQASSSPDMPIDLEKLATERIEQLEIFQTQWIAWAALSEGGVVSAAAALSNDMREGLRIAIDRRLMDQIRDGSPWRPTERPALLRTFQRAMSVGEYCTQGNEVNRLGFEREMNTVPRVEVPQLTKQAGDLRGRLVRMRGRPISNVTATEAKSDRWGEFLYDVVWIYPDDNSQQPVCLYTLKSWDLWAKLFSNPQGPTSAPKGGWPTISPDRIGKTNANMESVEVTGFFLKRLAYASPRGVDVAPIIVVCNARWVDESIRKGLDASELSAALSTEESKDGGQSDISNSTSIALLSKSASPISHWREPGVYRSQLRLMNEVLGESLGNITPSTLQELVRPTNDRNPSNENAATEDLKTESTGESKSFDSILQVLYQMPRLAGPTLPLLSIAP